MWDAQKWIKGVSKGDSILFIYQLKVGDVTCSLCIVFVCLFVRKIQGDSESSFLLNLLPKHHFKHAMIAFQNCVP